MEKQRILVAVLVLGLLLFALAMVPCLAQGPTDEPRPQVEPSQVGVTAVSD